MKSKIAKLSFKIAKVRHWVTCRAVASGQDVQVLCHVYTVHRLCRHFPHVSQDIWNTYHQLT